MVTMYYVINGKQEKVFIQKNQRRKYQRLGYRVYKQRYI
jgi:hypothetical protein